MSLASVEPLRPPISGALPVDPTERFLETHRALLEERLEQDCRAVDPGIGALSDELLRTVGSHGRGGSRWRPLLTLAAAHALGGRRDAALDVAVAVELTHTASLVLDDLPCMDDADLRRGIPATHRKIGSAGAILLSVALLSRAVELLGRQGVGGALCEDWGRTVGLAGMAGGQAMDVAGAGRMLLGAERRLHREKSAALPAFALASGARVAGASDATCERLASFGRSLGWAYQLLDDIEDAGEDLRLGRGPGGARPLALSRRIMRQAYRRVRGIAELDGEGLRILVGLAERVAISESTSWEPASCGGVNAQVRGGRA